MNLGEPLVFFGTNNLEVPRFYYSSINHDPIWNMRDTVFETVYLPIQGIFNEIRSTN